MYAASDDSADMLYATRSFVPDSFLYLEQNGKRTILLSDLEIDRGRREAKVDEVASLSEIERALEKKLKQKPTEEQLLTHFLRRRRIKRAVVPRDFPLGIADTLAKQGIQLVPVDGLFWTEREFKSDDEIRLMRRAMAITQAGMARGIEVLRAAEIKPGKRLAWDGRTLTSEILRAEIESAILREGGTPVNTIVAGGDQACDPHERGSGPLKANSLIILDIFPRDTSTGYFGDLTRTVVRGRASAAQRKLWETVLEGQRYAIDHIRVGKSGQELQDEVRTLFKERGYPTEQRDGRWTGFFHGLGHGLGLEIHEYPRIARTEFKERQMLTVEPGLYVPGLGGVRHEDVGYVTADGFKLISDFPKQLEV
jgi:Xaa-Pro aminopeptidase